MLDIGKKYLFNVNENKRYSFIIDADEVSEDPRTAWDNTCHMICWNRNYKLGDKHSYEDSTKLFKELKESNKEFALLNLYLMDHSGISMSTSDYNDRWDSGQVGFIYCFKEDIIKNYSSNINEITNDNWKEKALEVMKEEVKIYSYYIEGAVYDFSWSLQEKCPHCGEWHTTEEDSCGGFYGYEYEEPMKEYLPKELVELLEKENF